MTAEIITFPHRLEREQPLPLDLRSWHDYHGEETAEYLFGVSKTPHGWAIDPMGCCVCEKQIGLVLDEWGRGFFSNTDGSFVAICNEDHKRFWSERE